jgi:hypothetical protein
MVISSSNNIKKDLIRTISWKQLIHVFPTCFLQQIAKKIKFNSHLHVIIEYYTSNLKMLIDAKDCCASLLVEGQ